MNCPSRRSQAGLAHHAGELTRGASCTICGGEASPVTPRFACRICFATASHRPTGNPITSPVAA